MYHWLHILNKANYLSLSTAVYPMKDKIVQFLNHMRHFPLLQHCTYRTAGSHLQNMSLHHSFQECKRDVNQGSSGLII